VIIDNLDIQWAKLIFWPTETNAPLLVDPNGILPFPITPQRFQPVRVENGQVRERLGGIENAEPLLGLPTERLPLPDPLAGRKSFRGFVTVAADQFFIIDE
jgi:hypothetical protein